ncbi:MAG: cyclodeaminase/cyclohydrolase family protein [Thermodesulfobacteriota bacterium]
MQLIQLTLREFLDNTAEGTPVPGGGSIAALCGAMAAALAAMVARLTLNKKGYEEHGPAMRELAREAIQLRDRLADYMDRDAAAYQEVISALKLPRQTPAEQEVRRQTLQRALEKAADVPLQVARSGVTLLGLFESVIRHGNRNAVSDAAAGVLAARAGILAALYNVRINLNSLPDSPAASDIRREIRQLEQTAATETGRLLTLAETVMEQP